jgi:Tfp pilus assembly protein PilN
MVQINLLPPEIIERRKYDRYYPYVFLAAGVLIAIIVLIWILLQFLVSQRAQVLQQTQETTAQLTAQAESLAIFEQQRGDLEARLKSAADALAGRVDMGGLAEDITLVLPEEVWTNRLKCSEANGMEMIAYTPVNSQPNVKEGYKSVAATLVRLGALKDLNDVWLTIAEVKSYTTFQPTSQSTDASSTVLEFTSTGRIVAPADPTTGK